MRNKTLFILIGLFVIGIIGVSVLISNSSLTETKATLSKTTGAKILIDHSSKSVGNIPYDGGDLIHTFPIKNTGDKDLEIANMATSCMCTKAYLKEGNNKSEEFGMKGMTTPSSWKGVLKPGQTAEIIADFDPKYHGPSGTGPITRTVSFETNDPDHPYVEVGFDGVVTK